MRFQWIGLLIAGGLCANAVPIVVNGSFENPTTTNIGSFLRLNATSSAITGWTVSTNSLDWIGSLWQASDGSRSLDMAGATLGATILQDVTGFAAGQGYELQFDMAGNTFSPNLKQLQVSILDGASVVSTSNFTFDNTGKTLANMGWAFRSLAFTSPVGGTLRLQFTGLNNDGSGAAVDNVRLVEVAGTSTPEPASFLLIGSGLAALLLARRKQCPPQPPG